MKRFEKTLMDKVEVVKYTKKGCEKGEAAIVWSKPYIGNASLLLRNGHDYNLAKNLKSLELYGWNPSLMTLRTLEANEEHHNNRKVLEALYGKKDDKMGLVLRYDNFGEINTFFIRPQEDYDSYSVNAYNSLCKVKEILDKYATEGDMNEQFRGEISVCHLFDEEVPKAVPA